MRILVVGAGAAGVVAAKDGVESYYECDVLEMRPELCGTWVYTEDTDINEHRFPVYSATYKSLRENIPKEVMGYPDFSMPNHYMTYPTHEQMKEFLQEYTNHYKLNGLIKGISNAVHNLLLKQKLEPRGKNVNLTMKKLSMNPSTKENKFQIRFCNNDQFKLLETHSKNYQKTPYPKDGIRDNALKLQESVPHMTDDLLGRFEPNLHILFLANHQSVTHICCKMSGEVDKTHHTLPLDQPIVYLEAGTAFKGLTSKERLYAYFLSKASWMGGLITLLQTSPESGPIFVILHRLFSAETVSEFTSTALKCGFYEEEITALLVYAAGVFSNAGNYKGFGDTKFIPGIEMARLEELLQTTLAWDSIKQLWQEYKTAIYDLTPGKTCLGYPPNGCTTYFSNNFTSADNDIVQDWFKKQQLELYNTRCFKTEENGTTTYEIRLASEQLGEVTSESIDRINFRLTRGDYSPLMGKVANYLEKAIPHAANETEQNMLKGYIESFRTGTLDAHKTGSRYWIKDKVPTIESYIGFIETYRDPAGVRGEFEGFVAAVNKEMSEKFATLVNTAEELLTLLPWPRGFEKDEFLRPDFTSLDVLTFAGSGIPAGINIPNYDDIRQTEGFKNVSLGNVIPASYQQSNTPFLGDSDKELLQRYRVTAFEVQVGLHELLGHGSGKLLQREANGSTNYPDTLIDPLTGNPPASWYEPGDTYDSRFGPLSSAYEECRAEAVGLYLSLESTVLAIFGHEGDEAEDVLYVNWLSLAWTGVCSLEMWDPNRGWLQAHSRARFALVRVLIEAGVATVTQPNPKDLLLTVDRNSLKTTGKIAIGEFLLKLQIYKATSDVDAANKLFDTYTNVVEPWIDWREIVLANKRPRKMFAQPNLEAEDDNVTLVGYEPNTEGLIQSWVDRFDNCDFIYNAIVSLSKKDAAHFTKNAGGDDKKCA